jgi:hypothetical protein
MPLKKVLKNWGQSWMPSSISPILVASYGRSGSTLLYKAAVEALATTRFKFSNSFTRKFVSETAWVIPSTKFDQGVVYKSHDVPHETLVEANVKTLFVYGSPVDTVMSVFSCYERFGQHWINSHFSHLRGVGSISDLASNDILHLEDQLTRWVAFSDHYEDVLCVKYDNLWDHQASICKFTGLPIILPPKRPRQTEEQNIDNKIYTTVRETYGHLEEAYKNMPEIIWGSNRAC